MQAIRKSQFSDRMVEKVMDDFFNILLGSIALPVVRGGEHPLEVLTSE